MLEGTPCRPASPLQVRRGRASYLARSRFDAATSPSRGHRFESRTAPCRRSHEEGVLELHGPGSLFVVSGPSGAGKDTVVDALRRRMPHLRYSVSATTRPMRPGEREGSSYFFLDRATFDRREAEGAFIETKEFDGNRYGTPSAFIRQQLDDGFDVIMKPEVDGALAIKRNFPNAVLVFLLPDKFSHLRTRLEERRSETADRIASRLAIGKDELNAVHTFDFLLINEQAPPERLESLPAVDDLEAIVRAERFRIHHFHDDVIRNLVNS